MKNPLLATTVAAATSPLRRLRAYLRSRRYPPEILSQVDAWAATRRDERLREELIFEEAARTGVLRKVSQVEREAPALTISASRQHPDQEASVRQAILALVSANERLAESTQLSAPSGAHHLMALREVAFRADSFSAEISHTLNEHLAVSNDRRSLPIRLARWLRNPVGTGIPGQVNGLNPHAIYPATAALRLVGAVAASVMFTLGELFVGVGMLLGSVVTSGLLRFLTNAETAVTLRARYISCVLGHLGDVLAMLSLTLYLSTVAGKGWIIASVLTTVLMVFGSLMRTGVLSAGVHVSRLRLERIARVGGIAAGAILVAAGHPAGMAVTCAVVGLWTMFEISRVIKGVASSTTTHFAWIATSGAEGSFSGGLVSTATEEDDISEIAPDVVG